MCWTRTIRSWRDSSRGIVEVTDGVRLKRYLVRGALAVSLLIWAVSAALVVGPVVVGRARPWEGSLAFLLVFDGVAGLHLVVVGLVRHRYRLIVASLLGIGMLQAGAYRVVGAVSSGVELQAARIRAKSAATAMSVPVFSVIYRLSVGAAG